MSLAKFWHQHDTKLSIRPALVAIMDLSRNAIEPETMSAGTALSMARSVLQHSTTPTRTAVEGLW